MIVGVISFQSSIGHCRLFISARGVGQNKCLLFLRWGSMISELALKAAQVVKIDRPGAKPEIDLKRYAKVFVRARGWLKTFPSG